MPVAISLHNVSIYVFIYVSIYVSVVPCIYSRLLTCEADKTIKIWKENTDATEDTHPVDMKGWTKDCLALKRF